MIHKWHTPLLPLVLGAAPFLVACGNEHQGPVVDQIPEAYDASPPTGPCGAVEQRHGIEGHDHVPICTSVRYGTTPPSSGSHYPVWAAFKVYDSAIPEGYWVHDLEHGAVVISYNCAAPRGGDGADSGTCASDVEAAHRMLDALPDDPLCTGLAQGVRHRTLLVPDPKLDVPFAASAWGWTLRAQCFDETTFRAFIDRHYAQGPENFCDQGAEISASVADCGG
jgi:hypothetical protein